MPHKEQMLIELREKRNQMFPERYKQYDLDGYVIKQESNLTIIDVLRMFRRKTVPVNNKNWCRWWLRESMTPDDKLWIADGVLPPIELDLSRGDNLADQDEEVIKQIYQLLVNK